VLLDNNTALCPVAMMVATTKVDGGHDDVISEREYIIDLGGVRARSVSSA
jgi:hypothetical protein